VTHLRKMMLEKLERRNYSDRTARGYISAVADFAQHFGKLPDQLGPDELRRLPGLSPHDLTPISVH
jgi:integrase/recombinase XerD